jgi:hypothetical protein
MDYKITPAVLDSPIILNTLATFTKKIFKPPPPTLQIIPNFIYRFFKYKLFWKIFFLLGHTLTPQGHQVRGYDIGIYYNIIYKPSRVW